MGATATSCGGRACCCRGRPAASTCGPAGWSGRTRASARRGPEAARAWDRLVEEIDAWAGTAVVSHEFFAAASAEQAGRAAARARGAEVHVVVTARELLSLVTARWQEFVKNGSTVPIDDYPVGDESTAPTTGTGARSTSPTCCAAGAPRLPPERVHVLTLPRPDEPRETLWLRFAELVGIDPAACDASGSAQNESLGVVEVELLRRVNADLDGFTAAVDRGNWIRGYLAAGQARAPRRGAVLAVAGARRRAPRAGERIADEVAAAGYDVIGDVDDLRPPAEVRARRHPDSVTDAEIAAPPPA